MTAASPLPPPSAAVGPALEVRGLCCLRGDRIIFDGLSFEAGAGEVWQVAGPNGAGKTSLLRILAGLAAPVAGEVLWYGKSFETAREDFLNALLYLGHLPGVTGFLSARENLLHARALTPAASKGDPEAALEAVGLADQGETPAYRLSAGQRQRLALARFWDSRARLWVMDEPLTALDEAGRGLVERLLLENAARGGLAVVSTHHTLNLPPTVLRALTLGGVAPA